MNGPYVSSPKEWRKISSKTQLMMQGMLQGCTYLSVLIDDLYKILIDDLYKINRYFSGC